MVKLSFLQNKFLAIKLPNSEKKGRGGVPRKPWVMGQNGVIFGLRRSFYITICRNGIGADFHVELC